MTNPSRALARVHESAARSTLPDKLQYAKALAESGLLPSDYRKQPANVLYAVEYGDMLGLSPMAAITGIHVIEGKPGASPALMSALVRAAGHRLRVAFDKETMSAYAELTRADDPGFTYRSDWDLDRAVTAELCTLKDGKPYARDSKGRPKPWEKYTPNMLKWRCISEVCRDGAEECLMGMHYTPEELGAEVDAEGEPLRVTAERVTRSATTPPETPAAPTNGAMPRAARPRPTPATSTPAPAAEATSDPVTVVDGEIVPDAFDWEAALAECEQNRDLPRWRELYRKAGKECPDDKELKALIDYTGGTLKEALEAGETPPASDIPEDYGEITPERLCETKDRDGLRRELFAWLGEGGITDSTAGRSARLTICSRLTKITKVPTISSTDDLTDLEMAEVIVALRRYRRDGKEFLTEQLARMSEVTA